MYVKKIWQALMMWHVWLRAHKVLCFYYLEHVRTICLFNHLSVCVCTGQRHFGRQPLALTVLFTAALPSAMCPDEPNCVAASSPGACFPAAAGPAGPARPVTQLLNRGPCAYKRLLKIIKCSRNEPNVHPPMDALVLLGFCDFSLLKFWQARPSQRSLHKHKHFPSSRVSVPPL